MKVESLQSEAVLQLGKKIVEELGLDESVDTLGRWMAHYIAELIQQVEKSQEEKRFESLSRCANAIMDIWKHRSMLPDGNRPFEDFEPILRVLKSLDLEDNTPRYFRSVRFAIDEDQQQTETGDWINLVENIDRSAKILIRYCLARATENAIDKSKEWVKLAESLDMEGDKQLWVVRFVTNESESLFSPSLDEEARKEVEERIQRLENFVKIANNLSAEMREKLN